MVGEAAANMVQRTLRPARGSVAARYVQATGYLELVIGISWGTLHWGTWNILENWEYIGIYWKICMEELYMEILGSKY